MTADLTLAESIYEATAPQTPTSEDDGSSLSTDVVLGLLQRTRRLLKAVVVLHTNDSMDGADATVRSILEHAITGRWLLKDQGSRLPMFLRAAVSHLREMEKLRPGKFVGLADALNVFIPDHGGGAFPGVKKRMGDLSSLYWMYKMLSETSHPTFVASALGQDIDDPDYVVEQRDRVAEFVLFGAFWTWVLAKEIEDSGSAEFQEPLEVFRMELMAAIFYDPVTDAFRLP